MYNFTPYGQPGQPVRPSYNMLFSHFKQLGYSDELAGAEANRIMMQTNVYNQYTAQQNQNFQYNQNVYQNVNYNAQATQNLQYNNVYNQQAPPATSTVQHNVQPKAAPVVNPTPVKHASFDKSNLLSGVKISSRPSMPPSNLNASSAQTSTQSKNSLIKINLKSAPESKPASKGFHDAIATQQTQAGQAPVPQPQLPPNHQLPPTVPPKYPVVQPVGVPGYPLNNQVGSTYAFNQQLVQPMAQNMYYPKVPYSGMAGNKASNLSNAFYIDTKGKTHKKKTQAATKPDAPMTIDQVNKWIQDLYVHLNMTTCSKKLRKAVNTYIQYILEKFRSGSLTKNDLRMLSAEEVMEFTPPPEKQEQVSDPEPSKDSVKEEQSNKNFIPLTQAKIKKKPVKTRKTEEVVQKPRYDYSSKGVDFNEMHRREQRSQRFKSTSTVPVYNFNLVKSKSIVGLSQELEKQYLRLTSEPNPLIVRPENVLVKSFKYVFDKFMDNKNYVYIQEQFRSIRQDIQVQHLRSHFVVNVYTTNARLALLHNDLDQFNQCQTQLKHLLNYFQDYHSVKAEFELYYILYLSLQNMNMGLLRYLKENYVSVTESTNAKADINDTTSTTNNNNKNSNDQMDRFKNSMYFNFANTVRMSIQDENFVEYFKLADSNNIDYNHYLKQIYKEAFDSYTATNSNNNNKNKKSNSPKNIDDVSSLFYCKLLFKMFESKFRMFSLYTLCRSSLTLSTEVLFKLLNFTDENSCLDFLREHNVVFNESNVVDCKKTLSVIIESPLMRSKKI